LPAQHTGLPALADDAGLCVDAFGGLPGVDTAYYATQFGYEKGDDNNVRALLEQMQGQANRRAAMVSTLVAVRSPQDPEPLIAVGRVVGEIAPRAARQPRLRLRPGDVHPRVRPDLCRAAPEVKNAHSHRGRAAQQMLALMRERWLPEASKM
jgi:XTP/dITP diphosphohydrolase